MGAIAFTSPASAQSPDPPPPDAPTISVEGTADCWPYGEGGAYQWEIWWDVDNLDTQHDGRLASASLTVEPESAADLVEMDGLVDGEIVEAGLGAQGKIVLPHDTAVTGLSIEATVEWEIDGDRYTDSGAASVELGECGDDGDDGSGEELPELGEWTFDCETVEITFTNPFREELTFSFASTTGEVVEQLIAANGTETLALASSEGVEIRVLLEGEPIAEPIVISAEEWEQQGCDSDGGEGGEDGDDELPVTGTSTALIAGGAAALLALGGVMYVLARRRRLTFTA